MKHSFLKYVGVAICFILMDFFIFPISTTANSGINTKMLMSVGGLFVLLIDLHQQKEDFFNKSFLILSVWAIAVSLFGLFSVTINNTNDYTYSTYIISMWVWIFAAYFLMSIVKAIHGTISLKLIANYVLAIGIAQCLATLGIEYNAAFKSFIENLNFGLVLLYETKGRLQGISSALDPAGIRYAAILVIVGYVVANIKDNYLANVERVIYILGFILIAIVGNMVARTTTVGVIVAIAYWFYKLITTSNKIGSPISKLWLILSILLLVTLPIIAFYYNTSYIFRENLRFGFEGFFSLVETGEWKVSSNEILKNMIVWPDNMHTWMIGDGYIENPSNGRDPYYIGEFYKGYYKGTDIGYLRFIYYFGVLGLVTYMGFFIYACKDCIKKFPYDKTLFLLLLLLNFIVWFKVSTDIFQFFALFIAASTMYIHDDVTNASRTLSDADIIKT